jgi:type IV fimbrial biogenesis protein FimT
MTPEKHLLQRHRPSPGAPASLRGFSVVELMAVVTVLAILAVVSVPTFIEVVNVNRLASRSNDVVAMLQGARLESLRRGARVVVCASANGTSCATGATWQGWISFVDANANGALDTGETVLLAETVAEPIRIMASTNISGGTGRIVFRPDGFVYRADATTLLSGRLAVCHPTVRPVENVREISIVVSRISIAPQNGSGNCAAPGNPS